MRVLHVHSGNLYGGIETMLRTLTVHRGAAPGMEPRFALAFDGRMSRELQEAGAQVDLLGPVRFSRPWTAWRARRRLRALLAADRPDLVICHSDWSQVLAGPVVARARIPLVRWYHGAPAGTHWLERLARWSPPDYAVCNSDFTARAVEAQDPGRPHATIRPAAPTPVIPPGTRQRVRVALGVPEDAVVILQVGRIEPGKGHAVLLHALARLRDRPGWVAWEVGGGQRDIELRYLGELGLLTARLGLANRVRFLGEQEDVQTLYAAADIYCQPNVRPESYGLTFIEALHAGLPVVTSAIGGALEIVDQTCGILVPPAEDGPLAAALDRLAGDAALRRRLGAAGPARATALSDPAARVADLGAQLARWSAA